MNSMNMKRDDISRGLKLGGIQKKEVGNKVLPVNETTTTLSSSKNPNPITFDLKKVKGDRTKNISRMKEFLRWASAANSDNGKYIARKVSQFRNKTTVKTIKDEDQMTDDSPKISFRWEVETCSTFSSALSVSSTNRNDQNLKIEIHSNSDGNSSFVTLKPGSWITTDSDFVVLEL